MKFTTTSVREPTYTELCKLNTFEERFNFLLLNGVVGEDTFGWERYLNQTFYNSNVWKHRRREIIVRDNGCDLGIADRPIGDRIIVHHLVPLTPEMVMAHDPRMLDPEYLICVSHATHNALTYGVKNYPEQALPKERTPNDTILWKSIR